MMAKETEEKAAALADRIRALAVPKATPFVVSIDERSGSGKSTQGSALVERLSAYLLCGDNFFAGGIEMRDDQLEVLAAECMDWMYQSDVLQTLRVGQPATHLPFDPTAFDRGLSASAVTISLRPVVVFEGGCSTRPELADLVDFRVLVSVSDADCI